MNDPKCLQSSLDSTNRALSDSVTMEYEKLFEKKRKLKVLKDQLGDTSQKYATINCGGNCFQVDREALNTDLLSPKLRFALMSGRFDHLLPKDKNDHVFLDLDVKWMQPHLQCCKIW
jgi:hypothetical protein